MHLHKLRAGVLAIGVAGILSWAHTAIADESGSFRVFQSLSYDFTTIEHPGGTTTAGSLAGTSAVLESSGEPFPSGSFAGAVCVAYIKQSESSLKLEAPCTVTDEEGDNWFFVARRDTGNLADGGGGEGHAEIVGGTGKYAGITGECPYETEYLSTGYIVSFGDCAWERP